VCANGIEISAPVSLRCRGQGHRLLLQPTSNREAVVGSVVFQLQVGNGEHVGISGSFRSTPVPVVVGHHDCAVLYDGLFPSLQLGGVFQHAGVVVRVALGGAVEEAVVGGRERSLAAVVPKDIHQPGARSTRDELVTNSHLLAPL
jgi:hypothetical protein